jgi:hypothetical protein
VDLSVHVFYGVNCFFVLLFMSRSQYAWLFVNAMSSIDRITHQVLCIFSLDLFLPTLSVSVRAISFVFEIEILTFVFEPKLVVGNAGCTNTSNCLHPTHH